MEIVTRTFETDNGLVEGVQTKWQGFNILIVTGGKGFLACPAIDVEACQRYEVACAIVESIVEGMDVGEAFALIA